MTMESRAIGQARIDLPLDSLAEICRRYRVRRLALCGSALRDDFGPKSDIDLLVEFLPGARTGLARIIHRGFRPQPVVVEPLTEPQPVVPGWLYE
jgi:predicted nucleotidyltransferase